jgi:site-specific recombinase XerD
LPFSDKFANSIVEYLITARPETRCRTLFVRFKHTCGEPMGCSQIRGIVRSAYQKTGTSIKSTGTHILRRTAATKIYNAGNSLKMTADILGHVSLDSTTRYTKADMIGLRQVVAPWPNVAGKQVIHDVK